MKIMIASAALALLFAGSAAAQGVPDNAQSFPDNTYAQSGVSNTSIEHLHAKMNRDGVLCATSLITTTRADGARTTRASVDCVE